MEEHLRDMANFKDSPAEYARFIGSKKLIEDFSELMGRMLSMKREKFQADVWINYYVGEMEAGSKDPAKFLDDPMLIERLVHFFRALVGLIPKRRRWTRLRNALLRLEAIASETQIIRDRIALAHKKEPDRMVDATSPDSLLLPN